MSETKNKRTKKRRHRRMRRNDGDTDRKQGSSEWVQDLRLISIWILFPYPYKFIKNKVIIKLTHLILMGVGKWKLKDILFLFVLSVFTYTVSNSNAITEISAISNFYYSNNIVPDETLTWQVAKFELEDKGDPWTVKTGKTIEEGDTLQIKITNDPDDLTIANYTELFTTSETWAEFYLNDELLGDDASQLNLSTNLASNQYIDWTLLLPTILYVESSNVSTFQHYYDVNQPLEFDDSTEEYEVTLTDNLLIMKYERHDSGILFFYEHKCYWDDIYEASYNIEWGYLDKLELYSKFRTGSTTNLYHLVLLNELSTQKASIVWFSGMVAFLLFGLVAIYRRRK